MEEADQDRGMWKRKFGSVLTEEGAKRIWPKERYLTSLSQGLVVKREKCQRKS